MDYKRIYKALMEKARKRKKPEGCFEKHHVRPAAFGGKDVVANLVCLTFREHYVAHLLLAKIYPSWHMQVALSNFTVSRNGAVLNSHQYTRAKKLASDGQKRRFEDPDEKKRIVTNWHSGLTPDVRARANAKASATRMQPASRKLRSDIAKQMSTPDTMRSKRANWTEASMLTFRLKMSKPLLVVFEDGACEPFLNARVANKALGATNIHLLAKDTCNWSKLCKTEPYIGRIAVYAEYITLEELGL